MLVAEGAEDASSIDGLAEYATQRLGPRQARLVAFVYVLPDTKAPLVVDYDLSPDGTTFERVEVGYGWAQGAQRRSDSKAFHRFQLDPWADACGVCLRWE